MPDSITRLGIGNHREFSSSALVLAILVDEDVERRRIPAHQRKGKQNIGDLEETGLWLISHPRRHGREYHKSWNTRRVLTSAHNVSLLMSDYGQGEDRDSCRFFVIISHKN